MKPSAAICSARIPSLCRLHEAKPSASHLSPEDGIHHNRLNPIFPNINQRAMVLDPAIAKQPRQKRERVLRKYLIDKRLLPFKGL